MVNGSVCTTRTFLSLNKRWAIFGLHDFRGLPSLYKTYTCIYFPTKLYTIVYREFVCQRILLVMLFLQIVILCLYKFMYYINLVKYYLFIFMFVWIIFHNMYISCIYYASFIFLIPYNSCELTFLYH